MRGVTAAYPKAPRVVILAGPNGAGKSTAAPALLQRTLRVSEFVNADVIAGGLSAFSAAGVAIEASEIMLRRIRALAEQRANFAFETTLAGRTLAPWLAQLHLAGYRSSLVFLGLPNAEMAIARVRERVRSGGHSVPDDTIRRRHRLGLSNFHNRYLPIVDHWRLYDGSSASGPALVASGSPSRRTRVYNAALWRHFGGAALHGPTRTG